MSDERHDDSDEDLFADLEVSWLREADLVDDWTDPTPAPEPVEIVALVEQEQPAPPATPEPEPEPEPEREVLAPAGFLPSWEPGPEPQPSLEPLAEADPQFWRDTYPNLEFDDEDNDNDNALDAHALDAHALEAHAAPPIIHEDAPFVETEPLFEPTTFPSSEPAPESLPEITPEDLYVAPVENFDDTFDDAVFEQAYEPPALSQPLRRDRVPSAARRRRAPGQRRSLIALLAMTVALGVGVSLALIAIIGAATLVIERALG